jgi:2-amino-4-hydroxy-6-hydroxymethyldihydropteridine diphosphokinase
LVIPHPHISERVFVLAPLADLQPDLVIPGLKLSVKELLAAHDQHGIKLAK